jgi:membrane protein implicated in regulation of membrane protease activity
VGLVAGAIAAHLGLPLDGQIVAAAVVGGGAVAAWHWHRSKSPAPLPANATADVNLDIGEAGAGRPMEPDGTATVKFRGANWTAVAADPAEPGSPGTFASRKCWATGWSSKNFRLEGSLGLHLKFRPGTRKKTH